jgi:hypothetical protein
LALRVNDDGSVPNDNPFVRQRGYLPEIYTLGHRNHYDNEAMKLGSGGAAGHVDPVIWWPRGACSPRSAHADLRTG